MSVEHNGQAPASASTEQLTSHTEQLEREPALQGPSPAEGLSPGAGGGSLAELRRLRVELAERVAALTWDLGGLTYEMAIRDHYRLEVLARRAAELQQADAQLSEVERLLATAQAGVHGACRACGVVHGRGASYCWNCGAPLQPERQPLLAVADEHQPERS